MSLFLLSIVSVFISIVSLPTWKKLNATYFICKSMELI